MHIYTYNIYIYICIYTINQNSQNQPDGSTWALEVLSAKMHSVASELATGAGSTEPTMAGGWQGHWLLVILPNGSIIQWKVPTSWLFASITYFLHCFHIAFMPCFITKHHKCVTRGWLNHQTTSRLDVSPSFNVAGRPWSSWEASPLDARTCHHPGWRTWTSPSDFVCFPFELVKKH